MILPGQPGLHILSQNKKTNYFLIWRKMTGISFFFWDRVSLCSPSCPGSHRDPPASPPKCWIRGSCRQHRLWKYFRSQTRAAVPSQALTEGYLNVSVKKNKTLLYLDGISTLWGWGGGSACKGACCQIWWLELNRQDPYGRRKLTSRLPSVCVIFTHCRICTHTQSYV